MLAMLAGDGLNTVQTYAFWSLHEPSPSVHEWGDNPANVGLDNVTGFLTRAAAENLFVSLRIGPFICGEWSYGGIPAWVNKVDSMVIRTHNAPWENAVRQHVLPEDRAVSRKERRSNRLAAAGERVWRGRPKRSVL